MSNHDYYGTSHYDDDPPRRRPRRDAPLDRPSSEYRESGHRSSRAGPLSPREDSDIEEIERDFPPPGYTRRTVKREERYAPRRARSLERDRRYDSDSDDDPGYGRGGRLRRRDDKRGSRKRSVSRGSEIAGAATGAGLAVGAKELWDRREGGSHDRRGGRSKSKDRLGKAALGVAGAVAGDVAARQIGEHRGDIRRSVDNARRSIDGDRYAAGYGSRGSRRRDSRRAGGDYYADTDYETYSNRPKQERRKSLGELALGALGIGAAADADRGGRDRHRHRRGSSSDSSGYPRGYSRSRSRGGRGRRDDTDQTGKIQQAAQAALTAAAAEAWRSRKEPGGFFQGAKARRILTAAAGAGGIDALVDRDPDKHSSRHVGEGAIGGLLLNRLVNGSRNEDLGSGRSRSRSRGRGSGGGGGGGVGGLGGLATAGAIAAAGKKFLDSRSKSRGRNRRYSSDESSRSPPPRARRSRSVSALIDKGMAKMGLAEGAAAGAAAGRPRRGGGGGGGGGGGRSDGGGTRSMARNGEGPSRGRGMAGAGAGRRRNSSSSGSSSDADSIFSLSEEEKTRRKMRGKEFLTAGLATVATVHAAHEVYESLEKRKKRHKMVKEGKMTPAEERTAKSKALVQDAFAVGLAGLGIKGAVGTWKEMKEQRDECHQIETKLERHRRIMANRRARGLSTGANADRSRIAAGPYNGNQSGGGGGGNYNTGPVYQDGNPYSAAVPAASGGYRDDPRRP